MLQLAHVQQLQRQGRHEAALQEVQRLLSLPAQLPLSTPSKTQGSLILGQSLGPCCAWLPALELKQDDTCMPPPPRLAGGSDDASERLALLGVECCNRVLEQLLSNRNWPAALPYCAVAEQLCDLNLLCCSRWEVDRSWAAARYDWLWHAGETLRMAGKASPSKEKQRSHLEATKACLQRCTQILERWPLCNRNMDAMHMCLAETHWRLGELEQAKHCCQIALAALSNCRNGSQVYAAIFVLWVYQNVCMDEQNMAEVQAALGCAFKLIKRFEGTTDKPSSRSRQHWRLLRRMERLSHSATSMRLTSQVKDSQLDKLRSEVLEQKEQITYHQGNCELHSEPSVPQDAHKDSPEVDSCSVAEAAASMLCPSTEQEVVAHAQSPPVPQKVVDFGKQDCGDKDGPMPTAAWNDVWHAIRAAEGAVHMIGFLPDFTPRSPVHAVVPPPRTSAIAARDPRFARYTQQQKEVEIHSHIAADRAPALETEQEATIEAFLAPRHQIHTESKEQLASVQHEQVTLAQESTTASTECLAAEASLSALAVEQQHQIETPQAGRRETIGDEAVQQATEVIVQQEHATAPVTSQLASTEHIEAPQQAKGLSLREVLSDIPPPDDASKQEPANEEEKKMPSSQDASSKLPFTDVASFMANTLLEGAGPEPEVEVSHGLLDSCEAIESISTDGSIDLGLADVLPALQVSFVLNPQGTESPLVELEISHIIQQGGAGSLAAERTNLKAEPSKPSCGEGACQDRPVSCSSNSCLQAIGQQQQQQHVARAGADLQKPPLPDKVPQPRASMRAASAPRARQLPSHRRSSATSEAGSAKALRSPRSDRSVQSARFGRRRSSGSQSLTSRASDPQRAQLQGSVVWAFRGVKEQIQPEHLRKGIFQEPKRGCERGQELTEVHC